ncbi:MAG: hypothetical protein ACN6OP_27475 [Pseudomonadales bacterium]
MGPNSVVTLLTADTAIETLGERIGLVLSGISHRVVMPGAIRQGETGQSADIAFLTQDVTGNLGKTALAPSLTGFYEAMRAWPALKWLQTHSAAEGRPIYAELKRRAVIVTTASGRTQSLSPKWHSWAYWR